MSKEIEQKQNRNKGRIKGILKTTAQVVTISIPFLLGSGSVGLSVAAVSDLADANARISTIEQSLNYSELVHALGDDEIAMKIINNALNGFYGVEAQSYVDSMIASRAMIGVEKVRKNDDILGIFAGLLGAATSYGLVFMIADSIKYEKEKERKQQEEKELAV